MTSMGDSRTAGPVSRMQLALIAAASLLLGGAGVAAAVSRGIPPAGAPTHDVADYVTRGFDWETTWLSGGTGAWDLLTAPDPHPAGHPAIVGLAFALVGNSATVESGLALAESLCGLLLLVAVGWRIGGRTGAAAGSLAAALTANSLLFKTMATAPMTEPLSTVVIAASLLAVPTSKHGSLVPLSLAAIAAGLVRFNLLPTILLGATAALLVHRRSDFGRSLMILWAPPVGLAAAVAWRSPEYADAVLRFFKNVDSGVPAISLENGRWFAGAWVRQVFATPPLAAVGALACASSAVLRVRQRYPTDLRERTLGLLLVVGFGSLLAHPFKLDRNLYGLVGPTLLWCLLPVFRWATSPWKAATVTAVTASLAAALGSETRATSSEPYYDDDRHLGHAVELIAATAEVADRVVLVGAYRQLSPAVIEYSLRRAGSRAAILIQEDYPPSCATALGADSPRCQPLLVGQWSDERGSVFVTIAPTSAAGGRQAWRDDAWSASEAWLVRRGYRFEEITLRTQGLRVRTYR